MKPVVLVATTSCWFPTARLVIALAGSGFTPEIVSPRSHPIRSTSIGSEVRAYRGLSPLSSFARAIGETKPDLIVPGDSLAATHLHELHAREINRGKGSRYLCELIRRSLGEPECFPIVDARASFMNLASQEGVRAPKTQAIRCDDDLYIWESRMGFPAVLKADGTSGGEGVRVVHTIDEAKRAARKLQSPPLLARAAKRALVDRDWTSVLPCVLRRRSAVSIQGYVPGWEATSTVACWKGKVLAGLHFEVLKKTEPAGPASVVRLIENADMADAAEKMVSRLKLSGILGFDFILEAGSGKAHLIEINPRATQVGHLTLGVGMDLPAALYSAVTGEAIKPAPKVTEKRTIALFPQEWRRDPTSIFLRLGYHDVPWDEPDMVLDGLRKGRSQGAWSSIQNLLPTSSALFNSRC